MSINCIIIIAKISPDIDSVAADMDVEQRYYMTP